MIHILFAFLVSICFIQADEIPLKETLMRIENMISMESRGAYLCFSEGDIRTACGQETCIWDQLEMEMLLSLKESQFLKSRLLPYTALNGNRPGEGWAVGLFRNIQDSWIDSYAAFPAAFLSTTHRKEAIRFLKFLQSQHLLIFSDVEIPRPTIDLLFGPNARCVFSENDDAIETDAYTVVLFAAKSSEKAVMMKWLDQEIPLFVLDFSGLRDAFAFWSTQSWEQWIRKADEIRILYTSALISHKFEERKSEYIRCLGILQDYGYLNWTYIVEAGPYTPLSFFEQFSDRVFYANTNDLSLINKGVNEAKASLAAFDYFGFHDEDMIVKLTGRYFFNDDHFLRFVAAHPDADAFGKPHPVLGIMTGCFAMRGKYYKRMLRELNLLDMEMHLIDIEKMVEEFFKKMASEGSEVIYLDNIGITANVANVSVEQW